MQEQRDTDHLKLLAIFHYIWSGFALLGMGFLVAHFFIMRMVMSQAMAKAPPSNPMPPQIMEIIKVFYLVFGLVLVAVLVCNVLSAIFLRQRKHRMFSIVIACLNCLQIPLGTTLGVFTLVVLMRESVRESYEREGGL